MSSNLVPDYGKLYRYVAAIMDESLSMPDLSPLESAIIADLMHGLGDLMRMSDTSLQRKVMCWKYKMLNYKFEFDDVRGSLDRIRKALTNDFSDLQRDGNRGVSGLQSFSQTASSAVPQAVPSGGSASQCAVSGASPCVRDAQSPAVPHRGAHSATSSQPAHTVPGTAVAPVTVEPAPCPSTSTNSQQRSPQQNCYENEDQPRRRRGRPRVHDWRRPIEKPRLFTMNPFCVPIRLLRLKPLLTEAPPKEVPNPGGGRQRSISVSSSSSLTVGDSGQCSSHRGSSIESESNQAHVQNSIRQVTGLYVPQVTRKNKKRVQSQALARTLTALSAAVAHRTQREEAPTTSEPPPQPPPPPTPPPSSVQIANGENNSTVPSRAFRCVHQHDGKMVLVPIHLTHPAVLSQIKTKEAVPVPRQMPSLKACPAVENSMVQVHPSADSRTVRPPDCAPVAGSPRLVDTSSSAGVGTLGHVPEQSFSAQCTVVPQAQDSVSSENLPQPLSSASTQKDVLQQMSDPKERQLPRVQQVSSSQGQNGAESLQQTGEIVSLAVSAPKATSGVPLARAVAAMQSKAPTHSLEQSKTVPESQAAQPVNKKRTHTAADLDSPSTPETATESTISPQSIDIDQQTRDGNPVQKLAQIIPKKRRRFIKTQLAQLQTTTEIIVSLPPSAVRVDLDQTASSNASKPASPKPRQPKKPKSSNQKPEKHSAPKKKGAVTHTERQPSLTESPEDVQKAMATSGSTDLLQSPQAQASVKTNPRNSAASITVQSTGPLESSELAQARQSENGDNRTPDWDSSPQINFSGPIKTYTRVPHPVTEANSALPRPPAHQSDLQKTIQCFSKFVPQAAEGHPKSDQGKNVLQTATTENCHRTGINSDQKQTHFEVSSMDHSAPNQNKKGKSSFKSILAQVASPHTSSAHKSPDSARAILLNSLTESRQTASPIVSTSPDQNVPNCLSSSSPPQSSHSSKNLKPMKNFLTIQDPETKPQSRRGRKKKTDESSKDSQYMTSKTSKGRGKPRKAEGSKQDSQVTRKRPSNFLDSQDISNMKVEIVTPEDVRERLSASMGKGVDSETEMRRKVAEAKRCARQSLNVVLDGGEVSLVSI